MEQIWIFRNFTAKPGGRPKVVSLRKYRFVEWKGVFFPVCLGGYFVQNLKGRIFARRAAEGCNLLQIIRSTYIFRGKESFRSEDGENRRPEPLPPGQSRTKNANESESEMPNRL